MGAWCKYPGCGEPAVYRAYKVENGIRYSVDHCKGHGKWAAAFLERGYADTIIYGDVGTDTTTTSITTSTTDIGGKNDIRNGEGPV